MYARVSRASTTFNTLLSPSLTHTQKLLSLSGMLSSNLWLHRQTYDSIMKLIAETQPSRVSRRIRASSAPREFDLRRSTTIDDDDDDGSTLYPLFLSLFLSISSIMLAVLLEDLCAFSMYVRVCLCRCRLVCRDPELRSLRAKEARRFIY